GGQVNLNWSTASESSNERFIVERTADMFTIERVTEVPGAGNSTNVNHYTAVDRHPLNGLSYYRLAQVDVNEKRTAGNWVAVRYGQEKPLSIDRMAQNEGGALQLWYSTDAKDVSVSITDLLGRTLFSSGPVEAQGFFECDISGLGAGVYIFTLSDRWHSCTRKFKK
ncbi:MAG: hypothetical protein ACE5DN_05815, partial [Flavobacteriales bacterium]